MRTNLDDKKLAVKIGCFSSRSPLAIGDVDLGKRAAQPSEVAGVARYASPASSPHLSSDEAALRG